MRPVSYRFSSASPPMGSPSSARGRMASAGRSVCSSDTCQWAFYDRSKNRSGRWCSMQVCGNRTKTRAYRARQRD